VSSAPPDIVGLGLATLDVLLRVPRMATWDDPAWVTSFGLDGGGMVGTACCAAARLGASVGFIGTAGDDLSAQMKLRSFVECGVDLSRLVVRPGPEPNVMIVYVDEATGERIFSPLTGFARYDVQPEALDRDYITSAQILHLDEFNRAAALQAARWMREAGRTVCIDCSRTSSPGPVAPDLLELLGLTDVLISGSGFLRCLTGEPDVRRAGRQALALGPRLVVETDGANGSTTITAEGDFHTPAFTVPVADTTGAGDVFHGAYAVALLRAWEPRLAAQFATAVSAIKCTRLGGRRGIPTLAEVATFLAERGITLPD